MMQTGAGLWLPSDIPDQSEKKRWISLSGRVKVVEKGLTTGKDKEAGDVLKEKQVKIVIDLHLGKASAKVLPVI